jgi:hypothetical protein
MTNWQDTKDSRQTSEDRRQKTKDSERQKAKGKSQKTTTKQDWPKDKTTQGRRKDRPAYGVFLLQLAHQLSQVNTTKSTQQRHGKKINKIRQDKTR